MTPKKTQKPRKPKTDTPTHAQDAQEGVQQAQGEAHAVSDVQSTVKPPSVDSRASQTPSAKSDESEGESAYHRRLLEIDGWISECDAEIDKHARKLKDAKKRREAFVEQLREAARSAPKPMPLFDQPKFVESVELNKSELPWRVWPLGMVGLSESVVDKLAEANLATVGDVADFSSTGRPLTDIDGIGQATAEKIEDALADVHRTKPWEAEASAGVAEAVAALDGESDDEPFDEDELE